MNEINNLNNDPSVHGIIVQLPIDSVTNLDTNLIINSVDSSKDVDGLTNINAGRLTNGLLSDGFIPCKIIFSIKKIIVLKYFTLQRYTKRLFGAYKINRCCNKQ